jgi:hypothetical protein
MIDEVFNQRRNVFSSLAQGRQTASRLRHFLVDFIANILLRSVGTSSGTK